MSAKIDTIKYLCRMKFIDTHCHLYLDEFVDDQQVVIQKAIDCGVSTILLPNIDSSSWQPMLNINKVYPEICFPMAGLHPTSVLPETINTEIEELTHQLSTHKFVAIGEIGIDLYWDKTHQGLQEEIFR